MKFKVGDKVRVVYMRANGNSAIYAGAIVIIGSLNTDKIAPLPYECIVKADNRYGYLLFNQLEPIIEELTTWEEVQSITQWNPQKVKV